jgi:hypothetical protein
MNDPKMPDLKSGLAAQLIQLDDGSRTVRNSFLLVDDLTTSNRVAA